MNTPIKPPLPQVPRQWIEFPDPNDPDHAWRVDFNFIMSSWTCLFGQGCSGQFGIQDAHTKPDVGCCGLGVNIPSREELARVQSYVDMLTEDELPPNILRRVQKDGGWYYIKGGTDRVDPEDPDYIGAHTRVRDGGCIFANRSNEGDGKTGCAFHHLGQRIGKSHTEVMPDICWQVPLNISTYDDTTGEAESVTVVTASSSKDWSGIDEDGSQDSWMSWWCIDTVDAYLPESKRVYRSMEEELRKIMGDDAYEVLVQEIDKRAGDYVPPTAGMVRNEGRPMLPLLVGNRTPKRQPVSAG